MIIDLKTLEKSRVHLTVEIPEETVSKWRTKAVKMIAEKANVPGFRKGHIPENVLIEHYGEGALIDQTVDLVIQNTYAQAVKEKEIQVVAKPEKVELLSYSPFKYEIIVAVQPEVKLKDYKKIKIPKEKVEITEKDVDEVVQNVQKRFAEHADVDRAAAKNDKVYVDFEGKDKDGVVLDGTTSKDHPLIVGENYFIPGFEDNLLGMKAGDTKDFELTFPKDYHAAHLQDKPVIFSVTMKKVQETKLPEINEEFVQKVRGEKMSKEDFLSSVKKDIEEVKQGENEKKREEQLYEKLIKAADIDMPDALIEEELEYMINDYTNRLQQQGVSLEQVLSSQKKHIDELKKDWRQNAHDRVAVRLIIRAIIEKDKPEVSDTDVENELEKMIARYPEESKSKAREMYVKNGYMWENLKNQLQVKKVVDMFLEQ